MPTLNSDGSASDTQTQINASSNGDTVLLPASGSYTWSAAVSIPTTKYITLDLNGRAITLSGASGSFTIGAHATGNNRITNGSIIKSGTGYAHYTGPFQINDVRGSAGIRVDNIDFSETGTSLDDGTIIDLGGMGPGVMDHCTFAGMGEAYEFIHITAWGPSDDTGWTNDTGDSLAGSANIFYIEDCTFTGSGSGNPPWIQGYYGCRIAIRHNQFNAVSVDMHGTPGNIGARWWEFYDNNFSNTGSSNQNAAFNMRAGSGMIYNNTTNGSRTIYIELGEEDTGYPADYQIGRGINQTLDPARVYSNWTAASLNSCECYGSGGNGSVTLNVDVYASARPGYSAYAYPHPLQGGGGGGEPGTGGHGRGHKRGILRRM